MATVTGDRPVAIVTGASYGIGGISAAGLAADGFDVVVTDLAADTLADTCGAIEAAGAKALALSLDVRDQSSIERCFADALGAFGRLDVLINNAGVPQPRKPIVETTREDWQTIIDVNLTGAFFVAREFARHLIAAGRPGHVISLASTFALIGQANVSVYGVSKAGVSQMTRMMAIEWAENSIRANAVAPGATLTPSRREAQLDPRIAAKRLERIPLGRYAEPEEVAAAICYLASPAAAYVNGHVLVLDGGLTAA